MIKQVKKIRISIPKEDKQKILFFLQKTGLVMLPTHEDTSELDLDYEEEIMTRCDIAIKKLSGYIKQNRHFFKKESVKYDDFISDSQTGISVLTEIEDLFDRHNFLVSENKDELALIRDVKPYEKLEYTTKELSEAAFTSFYFGYVSENKWELFKRYTTKNDVAFVEYDITELGHHILIYIDNDVVEEQYGNFYRFGFEEKKMPIIDYTFAEYIKIKEELIKKNELELHNIEMVLTGATDKVYQLKVLSDQMLSQIARKKVVYWEKNESIIFNGYISSDRIEEFMMKIKDISDDANVSFEEPTEFDNVPTLLENKKIVKPFETIMNTYSVPNYTEVDPAPVMAFWYWIIFGLMIGDVGYGLMILVLLGLLNKFKKPSGEFGDVSKVFFYSGVSSVLAGIMYGSFFGADFDLLKIIGNIFNKDWSSVLVNPLKDPIKTLIFSLGLGIIHLSTGLVMKIILSIKRKEYFEGLSKGLSWLLILMGLSLFAISLGLGITTLKPAALVLMGFGVLLMIVFGGLNNKSLIGKIFGGFTGLFKATSYLSDILSYSRILALVLSSTIIASTMNLLASLIQGNIVGMILSPLVYIIGHIFTFAMSMLSAYVHGGRLEYLEFFSKFFEGGGYLFTPFKFDTKYINQINN